MALYLGPNGIKQLWREFKSELNTELGPINTQVGNLNTQVGSLNTQVGTLNNNVGSLSTDVRLLGIEFGLIGNVVHGTCATANGTATKVVQIDKQNHAMQTQDILVVEFTYANTTDAEIELQVNGDTLHTTVTTQYPLYWNAGDPLVFQYVYTTPGSPDSHWVYLGGSTYGTHAFTVDNWSVPHNADDVSYMTEHCIPYDWQDVTSALFAVGDWERVFLDIYNENKFWALTNGYTMCLGASTLAEDVQVSYDFSLPEGFDPCMPQVVGTWSMGVGNAKDLPSIQLLNDAYIAKLDYFFSLGWNITYPLKAYYPPHTVHIS